MPDISAVTGPEQVNAGYVGHLPLALPGVFVLKGCGPHETGRGVILTCWHMPDRRPVRSPYR